MKIDLHVHSTASDGTHSPAELARLGADFPVMAVTDHDNFGGAGEFLAEAARVSPGSRRLSGVEISVLAGTGYNKFHLLAFGADEGNSDLNGLLARIRAGRGERNPKIVEKLNSLPDLRNAGVTVTMDEVRAEAGPLVVARPHFVRVLLKKGVIATMEEGYRRFLGDRGAAFVPRFHPSPEEAIEIVHAAHGAAVMAHPKFWTQRAAKLREGLARLKDRGLDGVEAVYSKNTREETRCHVSVAAELGLAVTAGSDFHGANKPDIQLGVDVMDHEAFLGPFFERLAKWR